MEHQGGTEDEPTKRVDMSARGTSSGQGTVKGDGNPIGEILPTGLPITHGSDWGVTRQGPQGTPKDPLQQHQHGGPSCNVWQRCNLVQEFPHRSAGRQIMNQQAAVIAFATVALGSTDVARSCPRPESVPVELPPIDSVWLCITCCWGCNYPSVVAINDAPVDLAVAMR